MARTATTTRDRVEKHGVVLTGASFRCAHCGKLKPASHFGLRKMADGTIRNQPRCRVCRPPKKD